MEKPNALSWTVRTNDKGIKIASVNRDLLVENISYIEYLEGKIIKNSVASSKNYKNDSSDLHIKRAHQSFSEVVNLLQGDQKEGAKLILECHKARIKLELEIEKMQEKFDRLNNDLDSIGLTIGNVITHLKISEPFVIVEGDQVNTLGLDKEITVVTKNVEL